MPCGSLALRLFGDSFLGRGPTTDLALGQIMIPGRAVVTAEEDDLQMPVVPRVFGKDGFQVLLGLDHVRAVGQSPPGRKPLDVSINRERWHSKRLRQHHTSGLVTHASKRFHELPAGKDLAASVEDLMRHRREVLGLGRGKSNLANELQNAIRM